MTDAPGSRLSALFESASALVHRTAWRITGRSEDAEDVLQSVFLRLLRSPPTPWPEQPVAYVHRAAVNASLDVLRRRQLQGDGPIEELAEVASSHDELAALGRIEEARLAHRLQAALPLLSPLEVEVFSLRCFEDRSNTEIAEMLGKTPNHVGVTLHSARTKLRDALAPSAPAPVSPAGGSQP